VKLEQQEKKLIVDIKKSAKNGQIGACKIQAKDLIRTKKSIEKFNGMKIQLQAISLRIQAVRSSDQMSTSMKDATRLLGAMNRSMNLPQLQKIAMDFEKENDIMDQRQEMMDDAIDDAMGGDELDEDEEADEIVNKVLDEIGVDLNTKLKDAPTDLGNAVEVNERVPQAIGAGADDDLQARLNSLKRG
jgi:charged multivesicular body protein 2A